MIIDVAIVSLERIGLALVAGGGIVLAACVRPFFAGGMKNSTEEGKIMLEKLSIAYWNRYNRLALLGVCIVFVLEAIRFFAGTAFSAAMLAGLPVMALLFGRKLVIDKQLRRRTEGGAAVIESEEQRRGHREAEVISKLVIPLAAVLLAIGV
ncbi:hypothetical protein [Brevibacillus borstelensis]|uniref:hypothetical protein n=1 Tax=Brevibacillus borstelensis TaxID=45462 RepID=UPI0030C053F7